MEVSLPLGVCGSLWLKILVRGITSDFKNMELGRLCWILLVSCICLASVQLKLEVLYRPIECERPSQYGDQVFIHYNGTKFETGELFDHSRPTKPYRFQLGVGDVIDGFEEGLVDMCPGEIRRLTIPPHMAYGTEGGGTPQTPGGTVIYDVELIHAEQGPRHPDVFKSIDLNSDKLISQYELAQYLRNEVEEQNGQMHTEEEEKEILREIFLLEDVNKDGYISIREFSGNKHEEL